MRFLLRHYATDSHLKGLNYGGKMRAGTAQMFVDLFRKMKPVLTKLKNDPHLDKDNHAGPQVVGSGSPASRKKKGRAAANRAVRENIREEFEQYPPVYVFDTIDRRDENSDSTAYAKDRGEKFHLNPSSFPFLAIHGENDHTVPVGLLQPLYDYGRHRAGSERPDVRTVKDEGHCILSSSQTVASKLVRDVVEWVGSQISRSESDEDTETSSSSS